MATIDSRGFAQAPGTTTAGIQEAIDALPPQGGTVEIPAGTFALTSTIKFPTTKPVKLFGHGSGSTTGGTTGATRLTMSSTYKDIHMIEMRGDRSSVEDLCLIGGSVAGKGRGIQLGRLTADDNGDVFKYASIKGVDIQDTPSYGIGFYGTSSANEATENNVATTVNGNSLCLETLLERTNITRPRSGGGLYIGKACTVIQMRGGAIVSPQAGNCAKLIFCSGILFDGTVFQDALLNQDYVYLSQTDGVTFTTTWNEEQGVPGVPTAYFYNLVSAIATTFIGPRFVRPASATGVCLFAKTDANCRATTLVNPYGTSGQNSTGDSFTTADAGVHLSVLGFKKISQPSGYVDMVTT